MRPQVSPSTIDIGFLEPVLQRMAKAIGLELTLRVVRACGGVPTYFPRPARQPLAGGGRRHGSRAQGGRRFGSWREPRAARGLLALREARNRQMMKDRQSMSVRGLARKYGLSRRGVQWLFAERFSCGQLDDAQDSLFPRA